MGLDMYLRAERYVPGYEHYGEEQVQTYRAIAEQAGMGELLCDGSPSLTIRTTCAYWRKANQIHAWFVRNVQDGEDDCGDYYVSREKLQLLIDTCRQVLASTGLVKGTVQNGTIYNAEHPQGAVQLEEGRIIADPRIAHELLPTADGFFFGSTDYDEWYWQDVESTVSQLEHVLAHADEDVDFYYHSSW